MSSIYELKPRFQGLLRPITRLLAHSGVTANQVTVAALLLSFMCAGFVYLERENPRVFLIIPLVLFVRMALNAIDGMLAREHGMKTNLGAILNELADVFSDSALYLAFVGVPEISVILIALIALFAMATEMTGVLSVMIGASRRYDGPMGKSDRAFVFGLLALLIGLGIPPGPWVQWIFVAVLLLLALTVFNRAKSALREAGRNQN